MLIAEDDSELRQFLKSALSADGYRVEAVKTGFELLARASASRPGSGFDLIISDIRMPGLSGLEVLARLQARDDPEGWDTPVILISAFSDHETAVSAQRLGAILFDKPFDVDDLRMCVMHVLDAAIPT